MSDTRAGLITKKLLSAEMASCCFALMAFKSATVGTNASTV